MQSLILIGFITYPLVCILLTMISSILGTLDCLSRSQSLSCRGEGLFKEQSSQDHISGTSAPPCPRAGSWVDTCTVCVLSEDPAHPGRARSEQMQRALWAHGCWALTLTGAQVSETPRKRRSRSWFLPKAFCRLLTPPVKGSTRNTEVVEG